MPTSSSFLRDPSRQLTVSLIDRTGGQAHLSTVSRMVLPAALARVVADLDRAGAARFAPAFALLRVAHVSRYRCAADEPLRDALVATEV